MGPWPAGSLLLRLKPGTGSLTLPCPPAICVTYIHTHTLPPQIIKSPVMRGSVSNWHCSQRCGWTSWRRRGLAHRSEPVQRRADVELKHPWLPHIHGESAFIAPARTWPVLAAATLSSSAGRKPGAWQPREAGRGGRGEAVLELPGTLQKCQGLAASLCLAGKEARTQALAQVTGQVSRLELQALWGTTGLL